MSLGGGASREKIAPTPVIGSHRSGAGVDIAPLPAMATPTRKPNAALQPSMISGFSNAVTSVVGAVYFSISTRVDIGDKPRFSASPSPLF